MKKIRKVNTKKRKQEFRHAQQNLQQAVGSMLNMPTECTLCHAPFDKKSKDMATTWVVTTYQEKNKIYLTCPPCWETVRNVAQENSNDQ